MPPRTRSSPKESTLRWVQKAESAHKGTKPKNKSDENTEQEKYQEKTHNFQPCTMIGSSNVKNGKQMKGGTYEKGQRRRTETSPQGNRQRSLMWSFEKITIPGGNSQTEKEAEERRTYMGRCHSILEPQHHKKTIIDLQLSTTRTGQRTGKGTGGTMGGRGRNQTEKSL